jgi:hypothetical protein
LVTVKPLASSTTSDVSFLPEHPDYERLFQNYSGRKAANTFTVALIGSLSENQSLEDSVRGGHPETESMQNDLALILLALLVPWDQLPPLFAMFDCSNQAYKSHCAAIWNEIKLTLPLHIQVVAQNIELLQKSKADAQVDAALRKDAYRSAFSQVITEDALDSDNDSDVEDNDDVIGSSETTDDSISLDTLYMAFSIIKNKWADSDLQDAEDIPSLTIPSHAHKAPRPVYDDAPIAREDDQALGTSPDFHNVGPQTLQQWQDTLAAVGSDDLLGDLDADSGDEDLHVQHHLPLGVSNERNPLIPITDHLHSEVDPTILERISRLGPIPTALSLTQLIQETLPLNQKQCLAAKKVLAHAIQHQGKTAVEAQDQMLLYIAGEGGVGKTRVIKAIELGYELLQRKSEVLLMAPTGAAAYNIGGRTIHNAMSINIYDRPRLNINSYTYSLWKGKTIMIIDEISMVSLTMLNTINQQCNRIQAVQQDSTAILGAMPIVVFMGDFHQFAPIQAQPLWQTPKGPLAALGQLIWHRFKDVIILDEQMRQQGDLEFQGLLRRAREGTMTALDVDTLNEQFTQSLHLSDGVDSVCVSRTNQRRHHINRLQIQRFAEARAQDIYVFPAAHSRTKKVRGGLRVDELLGSQDGEGTAKGPGLFLYTQGMPVAILYNTCTPLGLVNGARGTAAGIVPHPESKPLICPLYQSK